MSLVDVEILVKCQIPMNSRGMQRYDIIYPVRNYYPVTLNAI